MLCAVKSFKTSSFFIKLRNKILFRKILNFGYLMKIFTKKFRRKIWFGPWFVILVRNFGTILFGSVRGTTFLVRNSVVRFVFGLLVRDFRTGTKWFGSVRIFQKIVFFSYRTVYEPTYIYIPLIKDFSLKSFQPWFVPTLISSYYINCYVSCYVNCL